MKRFQLLLTVALALVLAGGCSTVWTVGEVPFIAGQAHPTCTARVRSSSATAS